MKKDKRNFIVYDDLIEEEQKQAKKKAKKKKKNNDNMKKILVIVVVIVVTVVGFVVLQSKVFKNTGITSKLFHAGGIAYGDINQDGEIKADDALLVLNHITGTKQLTEEQQRLADVDGNKKIDQLDAQLILKKTVKSIDEFPIEGKKYGYEAGDVNQDGKITSADTLLIEQYITAKKTLTGYQSVLADVSGDGNVTLLDAELTSYYIVGKIKEFPIINIKVKYYTLGDVNEDGTISAEDSLLISKAITGNKKLTEIQKLAADVNQDGKINAEDANMVLQITTGLVPAPEIKEEDEVVDNSTSENSSTTPNQGSTTPNTSTPNTSTPKPSTPSNPTTPSTPNVSEKLIYGDVDGNGKVESGDALLVEKHIAKTTTLTATQIKKADVNGDNIIDALDAELILKYVTGRISALSPGTKYYTIGDINGNGTIDASDVLLLERYVVNLVKFDEVQKRAADINQDGKIDSSDTLLLLRKVNKTG